MIFHVLTLFPDMIRTVTGTSITGRAMKNGAFSVDTVNIRDFSTKGSMRVDDYPYGGGAGMVMEAEPVYQAITSVEKKAGRPMRVIYMTPQAEVLTQTKAEMLALEDEMIILCGHYEGIDERVLQEKVTDYISIGDYVLTGGELGACVLIDAVARFLPGVLNNEESSQFESMQDNLLEYPQYTRPETWHGTSVPGVLLTGDHAKIESWRHEQSLRRTQERRPDLLENSFRITAVHYGSEESAALAKSLTDKLSRYGTVLDYGRKKIRRTRLKLQANDLLLLFAEEDEEIPAEERFRLLSGNDTPCVLLTGRGGEGDSRSFLEGHGFSVLEELPCGLLEEPLSLTKTALRIREKVLHFKKR